MRNLMVAIALSLVATTSQAQEVPEARNILINGAMLCDTEEDLQTLLSEISLNNGKFPEELPATCGQFVPRTPMPMVVTPLYWYETPMVNTLVARFLFEPNGWTQHGYVAYVPNPDWKPRVEDPDA